MADGSAGSDDELAHTATAPGGKPGPVSPLVGDQLGRFRLERQIGAGGMGVVHAAFDPDLERRVALKVLRTVDNREARERLLREARATARVEHPNVVVVFEVGSAGGRDYIAMELVEGETLATWLEKEHTEREIVDAFIAAGRGLAAAHAKGLVHRDFKPNNVLVRRDGRIAVTDFGLARGIERAGDADEIALGETLPPGTPIGETAHTPSSLSDGITRTGALLGTPAYMAPEQWTAGTVGPAADQFAFCVALWEAITGKRPFEGTTVDELKAAVQRGPDHADASQLPRRLRRPLLRGLATDPAKRWPTMDALLTSITRAERRPVVAFVIAAAAAVIAAMVAFEVLASRGGVAAAACEPPARDPAAVWSPQLRASLVGKGLGQVAKVFDDDATAWQSQRDHACKQPKPAKAAELACLDGVQMRFEAVRRALDEVGTAGADPDITRELLVDPRVCGAKEPPHLAIAATAETVKAFALLADASRHEPRQSEKEITYEASRLITEPCAHGMGQLAVAYRTRDDRAMRAAVGEAITASERCRDDRFRAEVLLVNVPLQSEAPIGPRGQAAFETAKGAVMHLGEGALVGGLEMLQSEAALEQRQWGTAIKAAEAALDKYGARGDRRAQLRAVLQANGGRLSWSRPEDLRAVVEAKQKWRPVADAIGSQELVRQLDRQAAEAQFSLGDVAGAHSALFGAFHSDSEDKDTPTMPKRPIDGVVVDTAGKPVAGAMVFAGFYVELDSVGPRVRQGSDRFVTTDPDGHFAIPDAVADCSIVAHLDARTSTPLECADHLRLVLQPTRHVEGKVALGPLANTQGTVVVRPIARARAGMVAPIKPDGSFELDGVATDSVQIGFSPSGTREEHFDRLAAGTGPATGVKIQAVQETRTLDVVARSTIDLPLDVAQVMVIPGKHSYATFSDLLSDLEATGMQVELGHHIVGEPPQAIVGVLRPGDLVAHMTVPAKDVTVCVVGIHGNVRDTVTFIKLNMHIHELKVGCTVVPPADKVVVIEAPPQKRFD